MSFKEAIKKVFNNYGEFNGRARRSEYWYWILFDMIVSAVLSALSNYIVSLLPITNAVTINAITSAPEAIWSILMLIPSLAVTVRRLHDTGRSGWSYFVVLIPFIGMIILLVWLCSDSQYGDNQYGESPKYPTNANPFGCYPPQQDYYNPQQAYPYYNNPQPQQQKYQGYYPSQEQPDCYNPSQQYYAPPQYYAPEQTQQNYYYPKQSEQKTYYPSDSCSKPDETSSESDTGIINE